MKPTLFAALALVCALTLPAYANPNKAMSFYTEANVEKDQSRHPAYVGKRSEVGGQVLSIAKRYLGTNPTKMRRLWCAAWLGMVERKAGRKGTGSNFAKSYAKYGKAVSLAQARPGDIVVTGRKGGGHVGYLVAKNGRTVTLISGNSGGRGPGRRVVAQGNYSVSRIIAVRRPA